MSKISIVYKNIDELIPYINNPRNNDHAVDYVASSIKNFGFKVPVVIDSKNEIITGHTRIKASAKLGIKEIPCIIADDLNEAQIKAFRLADNKVSEYSDWDLETLELELEELKLDDISMDDFGFDEISFDIDAKDRYTEYESGGIVKDYIETPFSILDSTSARWLDRKRAWLSMGIKSEVGRDEQLVFTKELNSGNLRGTSIFDPVLCELMYKWFAPNNSKVIDSFAGGSVRGVVASKVGHEYIGIDLREAQIKANIENAVEMGVDNVTWYCDDSQNIDNYVEDDSMDFSLLCPPYYDLEVYSDDPKDISNMSYEDFSKIYSNILKSTAKKIKENRFMVVVISDVRDKQGYYRGLTELTTKSLEEAGFYLYNDMIFRNAIGTAGLRIRRSFKNRKVVRTHQNILVYYKGDVKEIKNIFGELISDDYFDELEEEINDIKP